MEEALCGVLVAGVEVGAPRPGEVLLPVAPLPRRAEKCATSSSVNPCPGSKVLPFGSLSLTGSSPPLSPLSRPSGLSRGLG